MLDEEAPGPNHSVAQLIDECSPKDMSKRNKFQIQVSNTFYHERETTTIVEIYYHVLLHCIC
ncbi:hypothetical protein KY284_011376 [Solanum tuberosum]|nr:hypothetical protein KY284_011376 [Solanum tuberosum]